MTITNKAWIVQNTTHFTNDQIKHIIDFVNPFISSDLELNDPAFRVRKKKSTYRML